jgi:glyoxylase-like metal-dependent hydrolase (beta-lactamase superfamily II)
MRTARPKSVRIRAYDVGFGDCFLLSFRYATRERHVLIDFGSFPKPKRKSAGNMVAIAEHIRATCKGRLDAVVATHRHADHISGFATKKNGGGS